MAVLADARSQHARLRERRYRHAFKEVVQAWLFKLSEREWIEIFFFTRSPGGHAVSQWAISKIPPPRNPRSEMQGRIRTIKVEDDVVEDVWASPCQSSS